MNIAIVNTSLSLDIYGYAGIAVNKDYTSTAFMLTDKLWQTVKLNNLKSRGLNIWVYESGEMVFAGVEFDSPPGGQTGLEQKILTIASYAHFKHIGPYNLIKQVGQAMIDELKSRGLKIIPPYIEIYGHWKNDESKLETELLMMLEPSN